MLESFGGGPLYSDCTESVFRDEPEIHLEQLGVGIPFWIRRLEAYLKTNQFGYNGIALGDVNGDGLDDVYLCQIGGLPNRLLLHQPDGTVLDASQASGVDYLDNDGDQDLVMTHPDEILLLANDGVGHFKLQGRAEKSKKAFSFATAVSDEEW